MKDVEKLAKELVTYLKKKDLAITSVESCTGGGFAYYLTSIPGAQEVINEAFLTFSDRAKEKLGVKRDTIEEFSVYSEEVALSMAHAGLKKAVKADIGVGITGLVSDSDPEHPEASPWTVYIGIAYGDYQEDGSFTLHPMKSRKQAMKKVIEECLKRILSMLMVLDSLPHEYEDNRAH